MPDNDRDKQIELPLRVEEPHPLKLTVGREEIGAHNREDYLAIAAELIDIGGFMLMGALHPGTHGVRGARSRLDVLRERLKTLA